MFPVFKMIAILEALQERSDKYHKIRFAPCMILINEMQQCDHSCVEYVSRVQWQLSHTNYGVL